MLWAHVETPRGHRASNLDRVINVRNLSRPLDEPAHEGDAAASGPLGDEAGPEKDSSTGSAILRSSPLAGHYDALAGEIVLRHVPGRRVIDLGVGAPAISAWVAARAARMHVFDLAELDRDDPTRFDASLPLASGGFDVALVLGVLPHLGSDPTSNEAKSRWLLGEAARLIAPGGIVLVDIANANSLAGLAAGVRGTATMIRRAPNDDRQLPTTRSSGREGARLTRYDTLKGLHRLAPNALEDVEVHGIGVFAPRARVLGVPVIGTLLRRLDWAAREGLILRYFGARLLVVLRKPPSGRSRGERQAERGLDPHRERAPSVTV